MLPVGDQNIPGRGPATVTLAVIVVNVLVFIFLQLPSDAFTYGWAAVPREITTGVDLIGPVRIGNDTLVLTGGPNPVQLTLVSSMFMHGGWLHLLGNMLFLWIFGDNVEHTVGPIVFIGFYLVAGVIGTLAQVFIDPTSPVPSLGASGAISGVLAAYLVFFPSNRVLVYFFYSALWVPALVVIGLWALLQFIGGIGQIAVTQQTGGVAYMAHIGGFVAGLVFGFLARGFVTRPRYRGY